MMLARGQVDITADIIQPVDGGQQIVLSSLHRITMARADHRGGMAQRLTVNLDAGIGAEHLKVKAIGSGGRHIQITFPAQHAVGGQAGARPGREIQRFVAANLFAIDEASEARLALKDHCAAGTGTPVMSLATAWRTWAPGRVAARAVRRSKTPCCWSSRPSECSALMPSATT
jgi:hypothetical protein